MNDIIREIWMAFLCKLGYLEHNIEKSIRLSNNSRSNWVIHIFQRFFYFVLWKIRLISRIRSKASKIANNTLFGWPKFFSKVIFLLGGYAHQVATLHFVLGTISAIFITPKCENYLIIFVLCYIVRCSLTWQ